MSKELTIQVQEKAQGGSPQGEPTKTSVQVMFDDSKIELMKQTVCKGASNDEFELFLHVCQRTGLDPFIRQIYSIPRPEKQKDGTWKTQRTIQTGIDGFRLIADRTGRYCPGDDTTYKYDATGRLISATAYIKKQTVDGVWHTVGVSALYSEYCQKTRDGIPTKFWNNMPHVQLAKCSEALGLRKCFPAELSGLYTHEEMMQADSESIEVVSIPSPEPKKECISPEQAEILEAIVSQCDSEYIAHLMEFIRRPPIGIVSLNQLPLSLYDRVLKAATKKRDEAQEKITNEKAEKEKNEKL